MTLNVESYLTIWEHPDVIDGLARDVVNDADALKSAIEEMAEDWKTIANTYEGERKQELVDGLASTRERSEEVADDAKVVDDAVWDFVTVLRELGTRRRDLVWEVEEHNVADAAAASVGGGAPIAAAAREEALRAELVQLQADYETAVQACADVLQRLARGERTAGEVAMELAEEWNEWWWQAFHTAFFGVLGGTRSFVVTHGASGSPRRELGGTRHTTFLGYDVDVLKARGRLAGPFLATLTRTAGNAGAAAWGSVGAMFGGPVAGWGSLAQAVPGLTSFSGADAAEARSRGGVVGPLKKFQDSWRRAALEGMTPGVSKAMAMARAAEPELSRMSGAQTRAVLESKPPLLQSFKQGVIGALPVSGTIAALKERSGLQKTVGTVDIRETGKVTKALGTASKLAGPATTVATGVLTYHDERAKAVDELRDSEEYAQSSVQEIEAEAAQRAGAQTVGNVATSIAAAAAGGALAGSVVPGPGTLVGLAGGIAGGIAASVPIADTDGDGEKDSLAEAAGDGAEWLWNKVRGK